MANPSLLAHFLSLLLWILDKLRITLLAQRILLHVLAAGPIPQHVAFVMDGNRRYARGKGKMVQEGHGEGYVALRRVSLLFCFHWIEFLKVSFKILEICLRLNIHCVSVYAFAIDNFKRSPDEVDALMHLAENKLLELCAHGWVHWLHHSSLSSCCSSNLLQEYGVKLNVIGKIQMFPESVQTAVRKAEDLTKRNNRWIAISIRFCLVN